MTAVIRDPTPSPQNCEDDEENKDKEYDANDENSGTDAGAKGTTLPISSPGVHVLASGTQFENRNPPRVPTAIFNSALSRPLFLLGKAEARFGSFSLLKGPRVTFRMTKLHVVLTDPTTCF